ncbi:formylmethanofuran--tetrahydromethanopterin N-formyltransferase [Pelomicrobium sp. G1]|uniref:formylmethanofuran--tetrahydromethanopterin N-formyltransferase n=1 Tax=unclassified Pelomicrobium TaxID=2815318 RepID=UPI000B0D3E48|nr:MAG: formylmethanofuran--tetrahydromethanopterin formyltransferase [Burkholderiales bacterium]
MKVNGVLIDDTFAEAFPMRATRVIITADSLEWACHAARSATGFATSVIACGCEAGIERELAPHETPDGRPGVAILLFSVSGKELAKQLERRIGQCVLTCPTTAAFSGIEGGEPIPLGKNLRYFGDGFQLSKLIGGRRYWRVPVMDGEFLCEESSGMVKAVGGGNFLILAASRTAALQAAEAAVAAMRRVPNVILPFPGGVVRSGSKVGSKYKALPASTNDAFCPTLRGLVATALSPDIEAVLEIVIDGLTDADVRSAMGVGLRAVCGLGADAGVRRLSAGNYGGKLGPFHFPLREIVA